MSKKVVTTEKAPQAIGPYSQGIQAGPFVFISGQIALDPATGELISGDVQAHTERIMENIKAILEAANLSLEAIVKCSIFLQDMSDFAAVNEVYGSYFGDKPPARATVAVSTLPKGAPVEIDAIAYHSA